MWDANGSDNGRKPKELITITVRNGGKHFNSIVPSVPLIYSPFSLYPLSNIKRELSHHMHTLRVRTLEARLSRAVVRQRMQLIPLLRPSNRFCI